MGLFQKMSPFFCNDLDFPGIEKLFFDYKKTINFLNNELFFDYLSKRKNKFVTFSLIYFCLFSNPLLAFEYRDYLVIETLIKRCYLDTKSCGVALSKIHDYQKSAETKKKFSCQTRLLGLEGNLIMAMNSNFKIREAKSIIKAVRKYC
tara:strand:+ start:176 stop:619 length:444 start_codon:yes stop_codon:yes gene_type:complete